jgi:bifunctional non-homologous end joining protein LigD
MKLPQLQAMLATLADKPFDSDDYVFELKFDGYRTLANIEKGDVKLYSRNLKSFDDKFPSVAKLLAQVKEDVIFDGEVIAYDRKGNVSFQALQNLGETSTRVEYVIFDLLYLRGKPLIDEPLLRRKMLLQDLLEKYPTLTYSAHVEKKGKDFFKRAVKHKMEGMIAKHKEAPYLPGKRSDAWLKIKAHKTDEGVIVGFTQPRGSRKRFGALVLAQYRKGDELAFIGHTGTGFTDRTLEELYAKMKPLVVKKSPFVENIPLNAPITWIRPQLVAQLKFAEWTGSGVMRQPVFLGLREDKKPLTVKKEKVVHIQDIL